MLLPPLEIEDNGTIVMSQAWMRRVVQLFIDHGHCVMGAERLLVRNVKSPDGKTFVVTAEIVGD